MKFALVSVAIGVALFFSVSAHAQILNPNNIINEGDIDFKIEPEFPAPNESVTISIQSYVIDLNSTSISWAVDGKDVVKGYGVKMIQFRAKNIGQETRIKVIVDGPDRPLEKTYVFQPSTLDMIWEAVDSYAPPFYKGKTLPVYESVVKIAAIPDIRTATGTQPKDSDIVYTWKHENKAVQDQSGYGKSGLLIKKNRLRSDEAVDVSVATRDGSARMGGRIRVPTFLPQIVITAAPYEALANLKNVFNANSGEVSLTATPYFFTAKKRSDVPYVWQIGGQKVTNKTDSTLRIRKNEDVSSTTITASAESPSNFFESASGSATINFK